MFWWPREKYILGAGVQEWNSGWGGMFVGVERVPWTGEIVVALNAELMGFADG